MTDSENTEQEDSTQVSSAADNPAAGSTRSEPSPALTIVVQSWMTPIIGVVMLVLGLFGGYFGRPLLVRDTSPITVASQDAPSEQPAAAASTQNPDAAEIMQLVVDQTSHFTGSPDAPVTMIEFSDFQ